jgi:cell division protein FtsQ
LGTNVLRHPIPLPDRPSGLKLFVRRWRKMARPTVIISGAVSAFVVVLIGVNILSKGPPLRERLGAATAGLGLVIDTVVIDGRVKTPENLVRAALGATKGMPTLSLSVADARARLEALTWVRQARVERQLPGTIRVTLAERTPFALWQNEGRFQLVDRAGGMVTDSNLTDFIDKVPAVIGEGANTAAAGLVDLLATQPDMQTRLYAAVRVGNRRWNLCMKNGADVLLPEGAEPQALTRLSELQSQRQLLDRPLREIDLRLPDQLRLRPQGADGTCMQPLEPNRIASPAVRKAT